MSSSPTQATQVALAERPVDNITPSTFKVEKVPIESNLKPGHALVRVDYVSIDPGMRAWLQEH
ncbi:hypothetical protein FRB94_006888 [Tulasnella sp. JGI-2019a]|nr:hypothetical protein FRB94_006888 [Tulasnella sp. JGI-2019a]KAG9005398.1 hypothetical protein FRB93_009702 [Tulasnella sp. JGI-2019a]